jgi:hypothetical protein
MRHLVSEIPISFIEPGVYYQQQGKAREIFLGTYGRYVLQEGSKITGNLERTSLP